MQNSLKYEFSKNWVSCASHCKWLILENFSFLLLIFEHAIVLVRSNIWIFIIHLCDFVKIWDIYMWIKYTSNVFFFEICTYIMLLLYIASLFSWRKKMSGMGPTRDTCTLFFICLFVFVLLSFEHISLFSSYYNLVHTCTLFPLLFLFLFLFYYSVLFFY